MQLRKFATIRHCFNIFNDKHLWRHLKNRRINFCENLAVSVISPDYNSKILDELRINPFCSLADNKTKTRKNFAREKLLRDTQWGQSTFEVA